MISLTAATGFSRGKELCERNQKPQNLALLGGRSAPLLLAEKLRCEKREMRRSCEVHLQVSQRFDVKRLIAKRPAERVATGRVIARESEPAPHESDRTARVVEACDVDTLAQVFFTPPPSPPIRYAGVPSSASSAVGSARVQLLLRRRSMRILRNRPLSSAEQIEKETELGRGAILASVSAISEVVADVNHFSP